MKSDYDLFVDLCKRQNLKDDYANYFKGISHNLAMKKLKSLQKKIEKNKDFTFETVLSTEEILNY